MLQIYTHGDSFFPGRSPLFVEPVRARHGVARSRRDPGGLRGNVAQARARREARVSPPRRLHLLGRAPGPGRDDCPLRVAAADRARRIAPGTGRSSHGGRFALRRCPAGDGPGPRRAPPRARRCDGGRGLPALVDPAAGRALPADGAHCPASRAGGVPGPRLWRGAGFVRRARAGGEREPGRSGPGHREQIATR